MNLKLDSVLLLALIVPFIMSVRLSPGETPYWLFGLIFLGLLGYLVLDIIRLKEKIYLRSKKILLWFLIITVIGSAFYSAIVVRYQTSPVYNIHDITLQLESAVQFLLQGKNPYAVTYFGTPLEGWYYSEKEVNPALYHFVMGPFYLLFALPFYFLSLPIFGFFDGRMPLLFLFLVLLILTDLLVKDQEKKRLFLILLAFNPAMLGYALEGRSDIFMFTFLFLAFYLLEKGKYFLSGIPMALAFAVKQSVWPILPFYIAFLYFKTRSLRIVVKALTIPIVIFAIIVVPFLVWDARAFLDSTVFYLTGSAPHSYPISGYGLGMFLHQLGIIRDLHQYYPFQIWQILIGLPLLIILLRFLKRAPNVSRLILVYGIFLFVFWYLSRYFNNSHLGYLSMVFITAYFFPKEKSKE